MSQQSCGLTDYGDTDREHTTHLVLLPLRAAFGGYSSVGTRLYETTKKKTTSVVVYSQLTTQMKKNVSVCVCVCSGCACDRKQVENDGTILELCYISILSQLISLVPATTPMALWVNTLC